MPKTPHPKDSIPTPITQSDSYDSQVNPLKGANQASETYELNSKGNSPLGVGGETRGYAKTMQTLTTNSQLVPKEYAVMNASDLLFQSTNIMANYKADPNSVLGDRGLITRQVATYEADKFLGLNSIAEEKYGIGKDKKPVGISIQADGAGVSSNSGFLNIDYSDPRVQRGLSDLEVSDFITGQVDRHNGNIFIDRATGKVTGIDNDLGFPEISRNDLMKVDRALSQKMVTGMPSVMHQDTANKIKNIDLDAYRKVLSKTPPKGGPSPLSDEAIEGSVQRLKALQDELKKDPSSIQVVTAFNKNTYDQAIQKQKAAYMRTHAKCSDTEQGNNNLPLDQMKSSREMRMAFDDCEKTSYIGKIEMTRLKNQFTPANERPALVNNTSQANRVANSREIEAYQKMNPTQRKAFDKNHAELNKKEVQLDKLEKELGHLQHPGIKDKIASITRGGVKSAAQKDTTKIAQLKVEIANSKASLQQKVDNIVPVVNQLPVRPPMPSPKVAPLKPPGNTTTNTNTVQQGQGNAPKKITAKVQVVKKETGKVKVGDGTKTVLNEPKLDENTAQKNKVLVGELQTKLKKKPSVRDMAPELDHSHDQGQQNKVGKKIGSGVH